MHCVVPFLSRLFPRGDQSHLKWSERYFPNFLIELPLTAASQKKVFQNLAPVKKTPLGGMATSRKLDPGPASMFCRKGGGKKVGLPSFLSFLRPHIP